MTQRKVAAELEVEPLTFLVYKSIAAYLDQPGYEAVGVPNDEKWIVQQEMGDFKNVFWTDEEKKQQEASTEF